MTAQEHGGGDDGCGSEDCPKAEPKAKGSEPVSKATSSAPQPNVKAMPNPYMSYQKGGVVKAGIKAGSLASDGPADTWQRCHVLPLQQEVLFLTERSFQFWTAGIGQMQP